MTKNRILSHVALILLGFCSAQLRASPVLAQVPSNTTTTKVGNGDDGADLENKEKITGGILEVTRGKAVAHLKTLGSKNIPHLGSLIDELERTEMFLVSQNVAVPKDFDKGQEVSPDGRFVYARTFARPYSATRFFPAALMLSEQQLINLHIHEALHRALPEAVREDESVVSEITLALTDPNASFDAAREITVAAVERAQAKVTFVAGQRGPIDGRTYLTVPAEPPATERLKRPSFFRYGYSVFDRRDEEDGSAAILGMHRFDSYLHPFGQGSRAFGMGLSFSLLNLPGRSVMGPLQVSARYLLATWRGFDVDIFGEMSMYTANDDEFEYLPMLRDTTTFGISMRRDAENFYSENALSYTTESESKFKVGTVDYKQKYGGLWNASVSAGLKYKAFSVGGKLDLLLSEGYSIESTSGSFLQEPERLRVVKLGPELTYNHEALQVKVFAYQVINGTRGANLNDIADVMGHGAGQGYAGSSLALQF